MGCSEITSTWSFVKLTGPGEVDGHRESQEGTAGTAGPRGDVKYGEKSLW